MVTSPRQALTVVTATRLEARAVARAAPGLPLVCAGIALRDRESISFPGAVISCGLAGGVRHDLPTGTLIIPDSVTGPGGEQIACDAELFGPLRRAAHQRGLLTNCDPIATTATLVSGAARSLWANRGYAAVDMETGRIRAPRLAAVRVILDTPEYELSDAWLRASVALLDPRLWPQALWLLQAAPRCARLAAEVIAIAFN